MKRLVTLLTGLFLLVNLQSFSQAITGSSLSSLDPGDTQTITVTTTGTAWTVNTPTLTLWRFSDSLTTTLVTVVNDTTAQFSVTVPCVVQNGMWDLRTQDAVSGFLYYYGYIAMQMVPPTSIQNSSMVACFNGAVSLWTNTASGATFSWTGPNGFTSTDQNPTIPTVMPTDTGIYICQMFTFGCPSTFDTVYLSMVPTPIVDNVTTTMPTCFSGSDGTATVSASGGTPPYTYNWSPLGQNALTTIGGLNAGANFVAAIDANNCWSSNYGFNITEPADMILTFNDTLPSCPGLLDGSLTVSVSIGGTPPFTYNWSPGISTTAYLGGIGAGLQNVFVTDANGCTKMDSYTLSDGIFYIQSGLMDITHELCGQGNGSITGVYAVTSNPAATTYTWSAPNSNNDLFNVPAGTYQLIANAPGAGCADTLYATVLALGTSFSISTSSTPNTCNDACDGSMSVTVTGGAGEYNYTWSNNSITNNSSSTVNTVNNVCAGEYVVVVSDTNGCIASNIVTVNEPAGFTIITSVTTSPACGSSDGAAGVSFASGGTAPYTYYWSNGDNTISADSLQAGAYTVTLTDANGCFATLPVAVNNASGPTVTNVNTNPTCFGSNDGSIDLTISGGTAPITILWATGATTEDLSGLTAGVYDVIIRDASGCEIMKSYTLTAPSALTEGTPAITLASCGTANGGITVNANGGTAPYSYQWDASAGGGTSNTISNKSADVYGVTITDANGCSIYRLIGLSNVNAPSVTVDAVSNPNCQTGGGAISVTASGGTAPYNYYWTNIPYPENALSDQTNLAAGEYTLFVIDDNNCYATVHFDLPAINIFAQEICLITVDSVTNNNVVVWEKTPGIGIAEFKVYRETSVINTFLKIATVPFDSLSEFKDTVASTETRSWRYKLATVDSCGNESSFIAAHKTIHMNAESINGGNSVEITWDDYIGFAYNDVNVLRNHNGTGWNIIATLPASQHTYIDNALPTGGTIDYTVEAVPLTPCVATRAINHNTTRSNRATVMGPVSVDENDLLQLIRVYPNPSTGVFVIEGIALQEETINIEVFDMTGRKVFASTRNNSGEQMQINLSAFENGIYSVRISNGNGSTTKSLVIQK